MKILKLRLKNIHSLKGEHIINFDETPLSDTGIFAITGPTGAGKSSLLDAISLALFNRTPRIGLMTKSSVENYGAIMTKNTDECMAELDYEVDRIKYRSKWEISRARTGALRDYHMELINLTENNTVFDLKKRDVPDKNAEIIGLNYDQFTKAIILSQGEFAKFLKADSNERGELLEKITGTEIYREIGKAAFQRNKEEKLKLEQLNLQFNSIQLISIEEFTTILQQITENEISVKQQNELAENFAEQLKFKEQISQLEKKKNADQKNLTIINTEIVEFQTELKKLEIHNKLLRSKSDFDAIKTLNNQLANSENSKQKCYEAIKIAEKQIEKNTSELENLKSRYKILIDQREVYLPVFKEVRQLDSNLKLLKEKLSELNNEQLKKKDFHNKQKIEYANLSKLIDNEKHQLLTLDKWLLDNSLLTNLPSEMQAYKEKNNMLLRFENDAQTVFINAKLLNINKNEFQKGLSVLLSTLQNENTKIENLIKTLNSGLQHNIGNLQQLKEEREKLYAVHKLVSELINLSKDFIAAGNEKNGIVKEKEELSILSERQTIDIKQLSEKIAILELKIKELQTRKERQQLEMKYNEARKNLKENEACPLCGSTTHPFVTNYLNAIDSTTNELNTNVLELESANKNLKKFEKQLTQFETSIKEKEQNVLKINAKTEKLAANFGKINSSGNLNFKIENTIEIENFIAEIIETGTKLKGEIDKLEKLKSLNDDISKISHVIQACEKAISFKDEFKNSLKKYETILVEVPENEWINTLDKLQKNFAENKNKQEKLERQIAINKNVLSEKADQIARFNNEIAELQTVIEQNNSQYNEYNKQRNELFGNKQPDNEENKLEKQINEISKLQNNAEKQLISFDAELNTQKIRKGEFEDKILEINSLITKHNEIVLPVLQSVDFKNVEEALAALLPETKVKQIEKRHTELNDRKILLSENVAQAAQQIAELQIKISSEFSEADLKTKLTEIKANVQKMNQTIGILKNKVETQKTNELRANELKYNVVAQEKECFRWEMLKDIIGDAEGKQFSKFAQELTLNQLIIKANKQLASLNNRYKIAIGKGNAKDDLIVVDSFQGNAERSVKTLSGGESFLISLALALALSDLAGNNARIESIFIDEGFGSLDQEALDLALNALEKMQAETNRIIGVISHIDSLKERIRCRIELKKSSTGFSKIQVI